MKTFDEYLAEHGDDLFPEKVVDNVSSPQWNRLLDLIREDWHPTFAAASDETVKKANEIALASALEAMLELAPAIDSSTWAEAFANVLHVGQVATLMDLISSGESKGVYV